MAGAALDRAPARPEPGEAPPPPVGGPAPRRRVPKAVVIAGAGVLVVGAVAGAALVASDDGGGKRPTAAAPSAWATEAGKRLLADPGLSYSGTVTADGKPLQLRMRVSRDGIASGSLTATGTPPTGGGSDGGVTSSTTAGTATAALVTAGGATYVKASAAFWRTYGGETSRPDNYAGRWTKAPAALFGVDVRDLLSPKAIAKLLAKGPSKPPTEDVNGTRAYRVKTPRADYLLTAAAPHRLLLVQTAGRGDPKFGVTELTDAGPLLAEARPRVKALGGAVDPALRFSPGSATFVNCNENVNGCTVTVPATLTSPTGSVPDGARASAWVTITSQGRALGRCRGAEAVPSGRSLTLRCTVVGRSWRTWMQRAMDQPGKHSYQAGVRVLGEAVSTEKAVELLAALDRELGAGKTAPKTEAGSVPTSVPTSKRP